VVIILERNLYVRASELWNKTAIVAKDASGRVKWITLDPRYHSILVRTAIATVRANGPSHSIATVKEAVFVYLLDIINGKLQRNFFTRSEGEKGSIKEIRRDRQPDHKRNQATSREEGTPSPAGPHPTHTRSKPWLTATPCQTYSKPC
jgi:hypothetical protein